MKYTTRMRHSAVERAAFAFIRWIGSPTSIILHTLIFAAVITLLFLHIFSFDVVILIFNTAVSLEAIYLALFIQMTVNAQASSIEEVQEDVEEMQEDIGEIQEDVEDISEDVEEISEDVEELQEDVEEISEDVGEMSEEDEKKLQNHEVRTEMLAAIQADLRKLSADIEMLRKAE